MSTKAHKHYSKHLKWENSLNAQQTTNGQQHALFCPRWHHPTIQSTECSCAILSTGASSHNRKHGALLRYSVHGGIIPQYKAWSAPASYSMDEPRKEACLRCMSPLMLTIRSGPSVEREAPRCGWALAGRGKECLPG